MPAQALDALAAADALFSLTLSRRGALWSAKGLPRAKPAPLFAAAGLDEADGSPPAALPRHAAVEEVVHDYETIRLSLKAHPMSFLRERFAAEGVRPCEEANAIGHGGKAAIAGVVLVRQRPGSAKGVCFITLEDETGITNIVVWPSIFEQFRPTIMGGRLLLVKGKIQRAEGVTHLVADVIVDRTADLALLSDEGVRLSSPSASGEPALTQSHARPRRAPDAPPPPRRPRPAKRAATFIKRTGYNFRFRKLYPVPSTHHHLLPKAAKRAILMS